MSNVLEFKNELAELRKVEDQLWKAFLGDKWEESEGVDKKESLEKYLVFLTALASVLTKVIVTFAGYDASNMKTLSNQKIEQEAHELGEIIKEAISTGMKNLRSVVSGEKSMSKLH